MILPARRRPLTSKASDSGSNLLPAFTSRIAIIITFLVGALFLIDQQLETTFVAAQIEDLVEESNGIRTEKGSFLAEFPPLDGPRLVVGELVVMEVSPITNTVVAYKKHDALLVETPRENIFSYWPITLAMTLLSGFLIIRWNHIQSHFELLVINLILLAVISVLYFVSH